MKRKIYELAVGTAAAVETVLVLLICLRKWRVGNRFLGVPCISGGKRLSYGTSFTCISRSGGNTIGVIQRTRIAIHSTSRGVKFGDFCGISGVSIYSRHAIEIGHRVLLGSGALVIDNDAHGLSPANREVPEAIQAAPITIEDDVFVGARAIILKGVRIGRGAVIGAGAVVTRSIPPFAIAAGNPARVVGYVDGTVVGH